MNKSTKAPNWLVHLFWYFLPISTTLIVLRAAVQNPESAMLDKVGTLVLTVIFACSSMFVAENMTKNHDNLPANK